MRRKTKVCEKSGAEEEGGRRRKRDLSQETASGGPQAHRERQTTRLVTHRESRDFQGFVSRQGTSSWSGFTTEAVNDVDHSPFHHLKGSAVANWISEVAAAGIKPMSLNIQVFI